VSKAWREMDRLQLHEDHEWLASSNTNPHNIPCPWSACLCTHRGCVAGWIDKTLDDETGLGKEVVMPCPTCRPKLAAHLREGGTPDSWRESQKGSR